MNPLTEAEGRIAAKDLLGPNGDCWFEQGGIASGEWVVGLKIPVTRKFWFWKYKSFDVWVYGRFDSIEGALTDAEFKFEMHEKARNAVNRTAIRARTGGFKR